MGEDGLTLVDEQWVVRWEEIERKARALEELYSVAATAKDFDLVDQRRRELRAALAEPGRPPKGGSDE